MIDKGLPKFMHSVVTGTANDGIYVMHNQQPVCVGKIDDSGSRVSVELWRCPEDMDEPAQAKMVKDMERWYFYKYVKK